MNAARASCVAVVAAIAFGLLAASAGGARVAGGSAGMTPAGLAAYGATYAAVAQQYQSAGQGMTPAGLRAYGDTYQSMSISYLAAGERTGIPVQWHDVFTGAGVTLGALVLLGAAISVSRNRRHRHYGRPTLAH